MMTLRYVCLLPVQVHIGLLLLGVTVLTGHIPVDHAALLDCNVSAL